MARRRPTHPAQDNGHGITTRWPVGTRPRSFGELVHMTAIRFYGLNPKTGNGRWLPLSRAIGAPPALVPWWADGTVKRPTDERLMKFCAMHALDYWGVIDLLHGKPDANPFGEDQGWERWLDGEDDGAELTRTKPPKTGGGARRIASTRVPAKDGTPRKVGAVVKDRRSRRIMSTPPGAMPAAA